MGIFCRKETGMYYLKIKDGNKYRKISLSTKNRYLAEQIYNAYLLDTIKNKITKNIDFPAIEILSNYKNESIYTQKVKPIKMSQNSLKKQYQEYLESCKAQDLSIFTIQRKKKLWELLLELKIKNIRDINQVMINKFLELISNRTDETKIRHIKNMKAFLNYCVSMNEYDFNLYKSLKFPILKGKTRDLVIDEKDYQKLVKNTDNDDLKLYLNTLWNTGVRPNEIVNLTKRDINFHNGTAKIFQRKTKKYKTIYLTDELLTIFDGIQNEYIFLGYDKGTEFYSKQFKKLRDDLELNKDYCLYTFRHSFGTRMLNKTKDIHLVSKLLGHSDISITAKHYINRSDEEIREKLINS